MTCILRDRQYKVMLVCTDPAQLVRVKSAMLHAMLVNRMYGLRCRQITP
jgi:hypothetical protein